jgi:hypothetical protein
MNKTRLTQLALAGMMAGSLSLTACENSTSSAKEETATGIAAAKTLADFQKQCEASGGTFSSHDCSAKNECKGHSFQEGLGVDKHDCKGHSACKGGSCLEA